MVSSYLCIVTSKVQFQLFPFPQTKNVQVLYLFWLIVIRRILSFLRFLIQKPIPVLQAKIGYGYFFNSNSSRDVFHFYSSFSFTRVLFVLLLLSFSIRAKKESFFAVFLWSYTQCSLFSVVQLNKPLICCYSSPKCNVGK